MAKDEKLDYTRTTRFSKSQIDYIDELKAEGISIRDVLDFYIINHTTERKKLLNEEKCLMIRIKELEKELNESKEKLKEVRLKLGKVPTDNQETLDIIEGKELILERCESKYGNKLNKNRIEEFLETKDAKRILNRVMAKYDIKDFEKWKKELLDKINMD